MTSPDDRTQRRMTPKLYERALLLYREFPGRHTQVASALSTPEKECTAQQAKHLWDVGLPAFSLPPIADALRGEVRALLGGGTGYDLATGAPVGDPASSAPSEAASEASRAASVCLNAVTPRARRKLRQEAREAATKEREALRDHEVRRIEAEARRAEAQAEASRQAAEAERAKESRLKAEASAGARAAVAGVATTGEISLVERRAQEAQVVGGLRDQLKVGSRIVGHMLIGLANKGPEVLAALKNEDLTFDEYTRLNRRLISTAKDLSDIGDKVIKLERLIFGEPTEHIQVESVGGTDPIEAIMQGIEAVRRAAERGVIDVSAEDTARMSGALEEGR